MYHTWIQVQFVMDAVAGVVMKVIAQLLPQRAYDPMTHAIMRCLEFLRIIAIDANPPESTLFNRSGIFFREAKRRGIEIGVIRMLGRYTQDFRICLNEKTYYFEGTPLNLWESNHAMYSKEKAKLLLLSHGLPATEGQAFFLPRSALAYGRTLGYPLAVKPVQGSLSHHVTVPVESDDELKQAMKIARQFQPHFIVERFVSGDLYRASVIGKSHVFVCKKIPANVCGDGVHTIRELVHAKNTDPRRRPSHMKNSTLHTLIIDADAEHALNDQQLAPDSIPNAGNVVYLHSKKVLGLGCDIVNYTHEVHPHNIDMFRKTAEVLQAEIVGIDFITPDISQPWRSIPCGIIEVNGLPYVDMHVYPSHGSQEPVAEAALDSVLERLNRTS